MHCKVTSPRERTQAVGLYEALLAETNRRTAFLAIELNALIRLIEQAGEALADEGRPEDLVRLLVSFLVYDLQPYLARLAQLIDGEIV